MSDTAPGQGKIAPNRTPATKRPLSVTIIGCLFVITGLIGLAYHLSEFDANRPFAGDAIWVALVRLLAVVCGVFLLRGANWARWVALAWMAYHVVLSVFHSLTQVAVHAALLAVLAWFLLRPRAAAYFRGPATGAT